MTRLTLKALTAAANKLGINDFNELDVSNNFIFNDNDFNELNDQYIFNNFMKCFDIVCEEKTITYIEWRLIKNYIKNAKQLNQFLACLPPTVVRLDFEKISLDIILNDTVLETLSKCKNIRYLDLSEIFEDTDTDKLRFKLLTKLPSNLVIFKFNGNVFFDSINDEMINKIQTEIWSRLPRLTSLYLSSCDLDSTLFIGSNDVSDSADNSMLSKIMPKTIQTLDLSNNGLLGYFKANNKSIKRFSTLIFPLPESITYLNLCENGNVSKNIINEINNTVILLQNNRNIDIDLFLNSRNFSKEIQSIPNHTKHINFDFASNNLDDYGWDDYFKNIPNHIESIKLDMGILVGKGLNALNILATAIPVNVKMKRIEFTNIHSLIDKHKSEPDFIFLNKLFPNIEMICLHYEELVDLSDNELSFIGNHFSNPKNVVLLDELGEKISCDALIDYYSKKLFKNVVSLKSECTFFVAKNPGNYPEECIAMLPEELRDDIKVIKQQCL